MNTIVAKRVYEPRSSDDGTRILVDRLWPRGLSKDNAALAFWARDIAPSNELRKWFDHRPERFEEFKRRYREELEKNAALPELLGRIGKGRTTLLYSAKDPSLNQAVVLAEYLSARL